MKWDINSTIRVKYHILKSNKDIQKLILEFLEYM